MADSVVTVDVTEIEQGMARIAKAYDPNKFMQRLGLNTQFEIDTNFRRGGNDEGPWTPLKPSTIASRRGGGGGAQPLRDTGFMAQGVTFEASANHVDVGATAEYAPYHQDGTHPYMIRASGGGTLRFMTPNGPVFRRTVHHPGIPRRPFLPSPRRSLEIASQIIAAIEKDAAVGTG